MALLLVSVATSLDKGSFLPLWVLILSGAPSSAGQARGGGDRQEATAGGTPRLRERGGGSALPYPPSRSSSPLHRTAGSREGGLCQPGGDRQGRDPPRGWG